MKLTKLAHSSKFQLCAIALAVLAGSNAYADTVTSATINPGSVLDNTLNDGAATGSAGLGAFTIDQYTGGVLTGASFSALLAAETINFTSNIKATDGTVGGAALGTAGFSLGGVTEAATSNPTSTTGVTKDNSPTGIIAAYTVTGSATTQAQLDALYGSGSVDGNVSETLSVNLTQQSVTNKHLSADNDNANSRTAEVTYTYNSLSHANGYFGGVGTGVLTNNNNTLSYSFGDIANGAAAPTAYGFSLYNLLGSYGLQVVSVTPTANTSGAFTLGGIDTGINNLDASSFVAGTVGMAAQTTAGLYSGSWSIVVADSAAGIAAGRTMTDNETLTLTVNANVLAAPVAAVPETESYAMLLAGLGLIGTIARRRNKDKAA